MLSLALDDFMKAKLLLLRDLVAIVYMLHYLVVDLTLYAETLLLFNFYKD